MKLFVRATLSSTLVSAPAQAQFNAGTQQPEASLPVHHDPGDDVQPALADRVPA